MEDEVDVDVDRPGQAHESPDAEARGHPMIGIIRQRVGSPCPTRTRVYASTERITEANADIRNGPEPRSAVQGRSVVRARRDSNP
jgi:hypothetical protein